MRLPPTISLLLWLALSSAPANADSLRLLIHRGPLAGAQYYAVAELLPEMRPGDALTLVREPGNRHDPGAIRIEWRGRKLGYLPRAANREAAAALDAGDRLVARIVRVADDPDPWRRVEVEVFAEL